MSAESVKVLELTLAWIELRDLLASSMALGRADIVLTRAVVDVETRLIALITTLEHKACGDLLLKDLRALGAKA